jgi:hypothetical protein
MLIVWWPDRLCNVFLGKRVDECELGKLRLRVRSVVIRLGLLCLYVDMKFDVGEWLVLYVLAKEIVHFS